MGEEENRELLALLEEARALSARTEVHRSQSRPSTPASAPSLDQRELDKWSADHRDISRRFSECKSPGSSAACSIAATPVSRASLRQVDGDALFASPTAGSGYSGTAAKAAGKPEVLTATMTFFVEINRSGGAGLGVRVHP